MRNVRLIPAIILKNRLIPFIVFKNPSMDHSSLINNLGDDKKRGRDTSPPLSQILLLIFINGLQIETQYFFSG
jgi:hypothetical protein